MSWGKVSEHCHKVCSEDSVLRTLSRAIFLCLEDSVPSCWPTPRSMKWEISNQDHRAATRAAIVPQLINFPFCSAQHQQKTRALFREATICPKVPVQSTYITIQCSRKQELCLARLFTTRAGQQLRSGEFNDQIKSLDATEISWMTMIKKLANQRSAAAMLLKTKVDSKYSRPKYTYYYKMHQTMN